MIKTELRENGKDHFEHNISLSAKMNIGMKRKEAWKKTQVFVFRTNYMYCLKQTSLDQWNSMKGNKSAGYFGSTPYFISGNPRRLTYSSRKMATRSRAKQAQTAKNPQDEFSKRRKLHISNIPPSTEGVS